MSPKIEIREETVADWGGIRQVVHSAFGRPGEAGLLAALRRTNTLTFSAVAELDRRIVAHVGYSPITIGDQHAALALAPLAVTPEYQRQGVGTALVRWSLEKCRLLGHRVVIVLGSPAYYARFGFAEASRFAIQCPFSAPPEDFMVLELSPGAAAECRGLVRYRPEFSSSLKLPPPPPGYAARMPLQEEAVSLRGVGLDLSGRELRLHPAAADAWTAMREAAKAEGVELLLLSGFRSIQHQTEILQRKVAAGLPMEEVLRVNAYPGYSEHHSGRAIDVGAAGSSPFCEDFEHTREFVWLQAHARQFGFKLSYPQGNSHGIAYEPWHWLFQRAVFPGVIGPQP